MSAKGLKSIFYVGSDIMRTDVEGPNTIMAQIGDATSGSSPEPSEWWQHVGFASRPSNVSGSGKNSDAAQAIVINRSDYDIVIASRDTRFQDIYGALKPGETCIYATGADGKAQGRILLKADGSVNLFTKKGNTDSGKAMGIFIDPAADTISILNSKGYGLIISPDGCAVTAKDSALTLKGMDVSLIAKGKCQIDGGGIVLGSIAVPGVNSALVGVTGLAGVASTKVLIAIA